MVRDDADEDGEIVVTEEAMITEVGGNVDTEEDVAEDNDTEGGDGGQGDTEGGNGEEGDTEEGNRQVVSFSIVNGSTGTNIERTGWTLYEAFRVCKGEIHVVLELA